MSILARQRYAVWKLQRPIVSNEEFPSIMAYTKNREQLAMIPMGEDIMEGIFGESLKVYVLATVTNGVLKVKGRVPDEEW